MTNTKRVPDPRPTKPVIVMHVGEGVAKAVEAVQEMHKDTNMKRFLFEETEKVFPTKTRRTEIYPQFCQSEEKAAQAIIKGVREVLDTPWATYVVGIHSSGVFRSALAGLITAGCGGDILVVHHDKEGKATVSWLDEGCYLVNWLPGQLEAFIDDDFLEPLDFLKHRIPLRQYHRAD